MVPESGKLTLEQATLYSSLNIDGGALVVDGAASLDSIALIELPDDSLLAENPPTVFSVIRVTGDLEIANSIVVDSESSGISTGLAEGPTRLAIKDTVIVGSKISAVGAAVDEVEISGSTFFNNGAGVIGGVINGGSFSISETTIVENYTDYVPEPEASYVPPTGTLGVGIMLIGIGSDSEVTIADDNVIVNNRPDPARGDILLHRISVNDPSDTNEVDTNEEPAVVINDDDPTSLGTAEQGQEIVAKVSVDVIDGILATDIVLEGVNVDVTTEDGGQRVIRSESGRSAVFWSPEQQQFFVDSSQRQFRELSLLSDGLVPVDVGTLITSDIESEINIPALLEASNATASEIDAWKQLTIEEISASSGATVELKEVAETGPVLSYVAPDGFAGVDRIRIAGRDVEGNEVVGIVEANVAEKSLVVLNVAASDLDDKIDVAVSTSGLGNISGFEMIVRYDPAVVELVDGEIGREYPFVRRIDHEISGLVSVSGYGGLSSGNDLVTLNFERIGEGSAGILLSGQDFKAYVGEQNVPLAAFNQNYYYLSQDDANRSGEVTANDALVVVNRLSKDEAAEGETTADSNYDRDLDANGDGKVTSRDALRVINRLDRLPSAESEELATHAIFSSTALEFLVTDETIPDFVGRPDIPLDDGVPLDSVDLTPPTDSEIEAAIPLFADRDGISVPHELGDVDDTVVFAVQASGTQIGFGLDIDGPLEPGESLPLTSPLTLAIFRADGTLIDGYPTSDSVRIFAGAVDSTPGEIVYFRVATLDANYLRVRFDMIDLVSNSSTI